MYKDHSELLVSYDLYLIVNKVAQIWQFVMFKNDLSLKMDSSSRDHNIMKSTQHIVIEDLSKVYLVLRIELEVFFFSLIKISEPEIFNCLIFFS